MKVAEVLADGFVGEGVDSIFALMGNGNMDFLAAIAPRVHIYNARHESMAIAMADGYARTTGKVGVATVTCGPGLTQIGTSLMVANDHRTPLVVFVGDIQSVGKDMGGLQDMDQQAFVKASGAIFHPLRGTTTGAEDVQRAFFLARAERRPVVLNAPIDLQEAQLSRAWQMLDRTYVPSRTLLPQAAVVRPDAASVAAAAKILKESERPILLAGRGALGHVEAMERLADSVGALLATTLQAKGAFDGHPFNIGLAGGYASETAAAFFSEADCVLAIGASLNTWTTKAGSLFPNAKLVVVNTDPHVLGIGRRAADAVVVADATETVAALCDAIPPRGSTGFRTSDVRARLASDPREADIAAAPSPGVTGPIDPRRLMMALDDVLPRDCIVVVGCGHFWSFPSMFLSGFRSREFVFACDFGAVGQGIGTALGVAAGRPDKLVVAFEGDASALMNIQELDTAARHHLRLLLFVLNDDALNSEVIQLRQKGLDENLAVQRTPSFADIARAFGLSGSTLERVEDARPTYDAFCEQRGTHVVDVKVDRDVLNPTYRDLHRRSAMSGRSASAEPVASPAS